MFFLVAVAVVVFFEAGVQSQCKERVEVTNDNKIEVSKHSSAVNVVPISQQAQNLRLALPCDSQLGSCRMEHVCLHSHTGGCTQIMTIF